MTKPELRAIMKARLKEISNETFKKEGALAAQTLRQVDEWKAASRVLLFASMENEFDTAPLFNAAFEDGKEVYAPRTEGGGIMRFYRISSIDGPWTKGAFGIREPLDCTEKTAYKPALSAFIVTPGLAFDRQGRRLGRGGGYYDRFFASLGLGAPAKSDGSHFLCGLCLAAQVVDEAPVEPLDQKVHALCAAGEYLRFPL